MNQGTGNGARLVNPRRIDVCVDGRSVSLILEEEFVAALYEIAARENETIDGLTAAILADRSYGQSMANAVRLFVVRYYHAAATQAKGAQCVASGEIGRLEHLDNFIERMFGPQES